MKLTRVLKSVFLAFILLSTIQTAVTYSEGEVKFTLDQYSKVFSGFNLVTLKLVGFPTSDDYTLCARYRNIPKPIPLKYKFEDNQADVRLEAFQQVSLVIHDPNLKSPIPIPKDIDVFHAIMTTHTVKPGETLGEIAREYYHDLLVWKGKDFISYANGIENPDKIYPGQVLNIPDYRSSGYIKINYPGAKTVKTKTVKTKGEELTTIEICAKMRIRSSSSET